MVSVDTQPQLIGYFFLPGRKDKGGHGTTGNGGVVQEETRRAPTLRLQSLIDRLQGSAGRTTNIYDPRLTWVTDYENKKVLTAVHRVQKGAPGGGNFLLKMAMSNGLTESESASVPLSDHGCAFSRFLWPNRMRPVEAGLTHVRRVCV
jgi:hypothetical protein